MVLADQSADNRVIIVGSPATAQDGQYQAAILALGAHVAERQMIDRLVDGGMSCNRSLVLSCAHRSL